QAKGSLAPQCRVAREVRPEAGRNRAATSVARHSLHQAREWRLVNQLTHQGTEAHSLKPGKRFFSPPKLAPDFVSSLLASRRATASQSRATLPAHSGRPTDPTCPSSRIRSKSGSDQIAANSRRG